MADALDLRSSAARHVGSTPTLGTQFNIASIAQLVEQIPLKDKVVGSSPTGGIEMRKPTIVLVLFYLLFANFAQAHVGTTLNDTFYSKVSSSEHLRSHYAEGDLRILIVPGHAQFESGTSYAGVYERDLNVAVASNLMKYLGQDNNLRIYLARDSSGAYARWF